MRRSDPLWFTLYGLLVGLTLYGLKYVGLTLYGLLCIIRSNIIYERNVFISIIRTDEPFGLKTELKTGFGPGLDAFEIRAGYMEVVDIEKLLKKHGIVEKVIFYGIEDIATMNPIWRVFSAIKKLTPNFVQFNKLPASKLQGVVTRVEM
jgi:KUP system potassium uptake protein